MLIHLAKLSSVPARWPEPNAGVARHARWAAYLLIPESMHTPLREPHTHFMRASAFGLALDFLVLLYQDKRT